MPRARLTGLLATDYGGPFFLVKFLEFEPKEHTFPANLWNSWGVDVAALNLPVGLTKGSQGGFVPSNLVAYSALKIYGNPL